MTSIDFYFNAQDRLQVACRLAGKAAAQDKRMLIYAPTADMAQRIDRLLWTWQAIGFVPHCAVNDPLAADTPVLIASGEETLQRCELLLNLSDACPPHFERFERLLEVIPAEQAERTAGRERYKFYRDRGYRIANHDLAAVEDPSGQG
jgi:DNA polymerase III subunit chi